MTSQTQQQLAPVAYSYYANKSVERQGQALHHAAVNCTLNDFTDADWAVFIGQGDGGESALGWKDRYQRLFLDRAAFYGYLNQIPPYVFAAMRPEQGYDTEFWLRKDKWGNNILDNAACLDNGKCFPRVLIRALWQGREEILQALWDQMDDDFKSYDGVKEAYKRFMISIGAPVPTSSSTVSIKPQHTVSVKPMSRSALAPLLKP